MKEYGKKKIKLNVAANLISDKWKWVGIYDMRTHNESLFTPWSFIHAWYGIFGIIVILKAVQNRFPVSNSMIFLFGLIAHTLYEIKDSKSYLELDSPTSPNTMWKNSFINALGDTFAFVVGMFIGFYLYYNKSNKVILEVLVIWIILFISMKAVTTYSLWTPTRGSGSCPINLQQMKDPEFQEQNPECYFLWG
jgi:hypothetical protein